MADAVFARREARRRKILENSQNRLQRISGKNGDESVGESPVESVIPEYRNVIPVENNSKDLSCNGISLGSHSTECFLSEPDDVTVDQELINDIASLLPPTTEPAEPTQKTPFLEKTFNYKYDIVLISLFIQALYGLSLVSFENIYFFMPVIVYVGTKMYVYRRQNNSNFANVIMLLKGLSSGRIHVVLMITQIISEIFQDICVFLFTTICVQSLLTFMRYRFVT